MNDLLAEWVEKAEGDFWTAWRELRARKHPNYDGVCFHCQQCAEKYLKGFLQMKGELVPKTHNLLTLLELCIPSDPAFELQQDLLLQLNQYAVRFRYPGEMALKEDARAAFNALKSVRRFMRQKLNLPE
jgi:HEPN domain-containing protein